VIREFCRAALLVLLVVAGPPGFAGYAERDGIGPIEEVDLDGQTLIVNGLRFRVALDAHVTIQGSFGSLSMLQKGMLIRYEYLVISPTEREITWIETRPPDEPYEAS
jgi:hypothetical protein